MRSSRVHLFCKLYCSAFLCTQSCVQMYNMYLYHNSLVVYTLQIAVISELCGRFEIVKIFTPGLIECLNKALLSVFRLRLVTPHPTTNECNMTIESTKHNTADNAYSYHRSLAGGMVYRPRVRWRYTICPRGLKPEEDIFSYSTQGP